MRHRLGTGASLVVLAAFVTAQEPPRVPYDNVRLLHRVEAEPVAGAYANSVTADIVIGPDGSVESVTVTEGHNAHRASATAALRQYRFAPVVIDGSPARVVTTIRVHVPDTLSNDALTTGADDSVRVEANPAVVLAGDCSRAIIRRDGSAEAIRTCRAAVSAANALPPSATRERRAAHNFLANVYMLAGRWQDALAEYETALRIERQSENDAYKAAEYLASIAVAHVNLGDLAAADRAVEAAVSTAESSMSADPEEQEIHARLLRTILQLHAGIKRQRGDTAAALALERKADALGPSN